MSYNNCNAPPSFHKYSSGRETIMANKLVVPDLNLFEHAVDPKRNPAHVTPSKQR